jgi:hypothetical protein
MATELATQDVTKLSLPAWLAPHLASVSGNHRKDLLPITIDQTQKSSLILLSQSYASLLAAKPNRTEAFKAAGRFLMATSNQNLGPAQIEAKQLAYQTALEDLPPWAIDEGIARWHRGETFDHPVSYAFPTPADLRSVCMSVIKVMAGRKLVLDRLVAAAEPRTIQN